jgi:hypothetical protein
MIQVKYLDITNNDRHRTEPDKYIYGKIGKDKYNHYYFMEDNHRTYQYLLASSYHRVLSVMYRPPCPPPSDSVVEARVGDAA